MGIILYSSTNKQRRLTNGRLMMAERLQRWPNIKPALAQRLVFTGKYRHAKAKGSNYSVSRYCFSTLQDRILVGPIIVLCLAS